MLSRSYYSPSMTKMVCLLCRNCDICGHSHVWRSREQRLLHPLPVLERFHSELTIDFMTDLSIKKLGGFRFLMILTDRHLKSVTMEVMTSINIEESAERFMNCYHRFHGFPNALSSDRDSNWIGDFW